MREDTSLSCAQTMTGKTMIHPPFYEHGGNRYDLSHLQPTQVNVTIQAHKTNPELELLLDVRFTNHCFSEGEPKTAGLPHDFVDHNCKPRWFCPDRHSDSLLLPELINQLPTKQCLFTGKHNWLVIEMKGSNGVFVPYHVYFTLKNNQDIDNGLKLFIESAYKKTKGDNSPKRRGSMDRTAFAMLARKTLAGEKVKRPRRR